MKYKMKIFFMWISNEKESLWIYAKNLFESLKTKIDVVDIRDKNTETSRLKTMISQFTTNILPHKIKDFNKKDDVILYSHSSFILSPLRNLKRSIVVVHDLVLFDDEYYEWRPIFIKLLKYWYKILWKLLYKRMLKKSLWIVAISEATKEDILKKFWKSLNNKIKVIYNWVDLSLFKPAKWKEIPNNLKDDYLCYIWSEMPRKNLKNIIKAFSLIKKEYPNLKLIKAPKDNSDNRIKTLEYIKESKLEIWKDIILINEFLPFEKLVELYQYSKVFIFPSIKEGFWFPIIEAEACWVPVITTNYNPMMELVPYKDMTVDPQNPQDIANKTLKILRDDGLRKDMIEEWISNSDNFTWENTANNFKIYIMELVKK